MDATSVTAPKYTPGQRVEVLTVDFEALHLPYVWTPGTVTVADPMPGGRWRVVVTCDNGNLFRPIVGKRGGNKRIRAL